MYMWVFIREVFVVIFNNYFYSELLYILYINDVKCSQNSQKKIRFKICIAEPTKISPTKLIITV